MATYCCRVPTHRAGFNIWYGEFGSHLPLKVCAKHLREMALILKPGQRMAVTRLDKREMRRKEASD